jgi:Protein of unknown function (DUF1236)
LFFTKAFFASEEARMKDLLIVMEAMREAQAVLFDIKLMADGPLRLGTFPQRARCNNRLYQRSLGEPALRQIQTMLMAVALLYGDFLSIAPDAQPLPTTTTSSINLTVEQRHIIKEVVKELKLPAEDSDVPLQVGSKVPPDVSLNPMPPLVAQKVPQVKAHQFFIKNDSIALVDPKDRTISEVRE